MDEDQIHSDPSDGHKVVAFDLLYRVIFFDTLVRADDPHIVTDIVAEFYEGAASAYALSQAHVSFRELLIPEKDPAGSVTDHVMARAFLTATYPFLFTLLDEEKGESLEDPDGFFRTIAELIRSWGLLLS